MDLEDYPGAIRDCDICGREFVIEKLRKQMDRENLYVCEECFDERSYDKTRENSL